MMDEPGLKANKAEELAELSWRHFSRLSKDCEYINRTGLLSTIQCKPQTS